MRGPSVLDLLEAVRRTARSHPAVLAWWMVPRARLRVRAASAAKKGRVVELALECPAGHEIDFERIGQDVSRLLPGASVEVRAYRGDDPESKALIRLFSRGEPTGSEAPLRESIGP
jgi:hypothetical protein